MDHAVVEVPREVPEVTSIPINNEIPRISTRTMPEEVEEVGVPGIPVEDPGIDPSSNNNSLQGIVRQRFQKLGWRKFRHAMPLSRINSRLPVPFSGIRNRLRPVEVAERCDRDGPFRMW